MAEEMMAERGAAGGAAARAAGGAGGKPRPGVSRAGVSPGRMVLAAFRPLVSPQTWLGLIHLLAGTVTGLAAFVVVSTFTLAGIATLWLFLVGLPVLTAMLRLCLQFARAERARFAVTLDVLIPTPPPDLSPGAGTWQRLRRITASPATWRQFGYALIRFPLSLAEGLTVIVVWSFGAAMLGLPAFGWLVLHAQWHVGGTVPRDPAQMVAVSVAGLLVLLAAPHLTRALVAADTAIARYLIGPGSSEDMTVRIDELERSRARVVDAAEAERRRIERDLHDGAQQRLVSLAMNLGRAKARFADDPEGARAIVEQAHTEAKEALVDLRNLVRGVHPPVLADRGLDAAISGLAALSPVPVTVRADLDARPAPSTEAIAYFVVAEALANVAKHARATRADVSVARHKDVLRVVVRDDGVGGADPRGQGLAGLADRVAGVDGRLSVRSPAGGPTVIEVELPCGS